MRILHVASFDGNIGDNASHIGFRKLLNTVVGDNVAITQLEIRKFYNNYSLPDKQQFDDKFAELANGYDLLFIGGGGFLDFDVKGSGTGTTINLLPNILEKIKTPIIISSIGSNPRNTIPEGNLERFRSFLDVFLAKENTFLAVRNDGSKDVLKNVVGAQYDAAIPQVLDHGFFYENDGSFYRATPNKYILINTTSDQVQMKNRLLGEVDEASYTTEMTKVLNYIINETDRDIVFAPHIYSDYKAIDSLLKNINDFHIRTRIAVTPYVQGDWGCNQIFSAYKNSNMLIGMRFHANVCSIGMKVPSIGLAALDRVMRMYESVGLSDNVVPVDQPLFETVVDKINARLSQTEERITPEFEELGKSTIKTYQDAFKKLHLI